MAPGRYADRPEQHGDDWSNQVRGTDARLHQREDAGIGEDDDGMEQQRHPGLPEVAPKTVDVAEAQNAQIAPDDDDVAADKRAMDQAQGLSAITRGYGINEGAHRDLVPGF
jgi:type IV secretion system protein VirD4